MTALAGALTPLAGPLDGEFLTSLSEARRSAGLPELSGEVTASLGSVASVSPFLKDLMLGAGAGLDDILSTSLQENVAEASAFSGDPLATLRAGKRRVALAVALADLCANESVEAVTGALSNFADAAIGYALGTALGELVPRQDGEAPHAERCGLFIIAMGKLGARELNYSSDIDLVVLYEPGAAERAGISRACAVRIAQRLSTILQERTADGYVFRVDLRLRPDPGSTPVAVTVPAAVRYYQTRARAWERQAMIKARVVAGDHGAGARYLAAIEPSIWRTSFDFNAIDETMDMRRKIAAVKGAGAITVANHNIKIGRGGIREVEFFCQSFQRVAGGRDRRLRGRSTVAMLTMLARAGWVDHTVADGLSKAYDRLRRIEHRLQMVNDEQLHTLPDKAGLARIATMMRESDFEARTRDAMALVHKTFMTLDGPDHGQEGAVSLPEDAREAFANAAAAWSEGRYACLKTDRAKDLIKKLEPCLERAVAGSADPIGAIKGLDVFLARLTRGIDGLSRLYLHPELVPVIVLIVAAAPRLAERLAARAHLLDVLVDPQFFGRAPSRDTLAQTLDEVLSDTRDYEDALDALRVFGQEQRLLVEVRILTGSLTSADAGAAHTAIAEVCAQRALRLALDAFTQRHGWFDGAGVCLLGLGSFGGQEMTAASDLDLVFLYETPEGATESDGEKPLSPGHYFNRLAQRLVAALSAPTAKGMLYEVDLRLRPSGRAGPLATHIRSFERYHEESAWTWEQMALTRARVVSGDAGVGDRAMRAIQGALSRPRDREVLATEVVSMRNRMDKHSPQDMKHVPGGLIDIEFIAQFLRLARGIETTGTGTRRALRQLSEAGALDPGALEELLSAHRLLRNLSHLFAIAGLECAPQSAPAALQPLLLRVGDAPDVAYLQADLERRQDVVRALFDEIIGPRESETA